mmetsp:Transcript_70841/g.124702  ORF Transcript_70841/g.124702 Transcript_70841/m.124702 type:complete len:244 (+) Transcript_70841:195-926(+)
MDQHPRDRKQQKEQTRARGSTGRTARSRRDVMRQKNAWGQHADRQVHRMSERGLQSDLTTSVLGRPSTAARVRQPATPRPQEATMPLKTLQQPFLHTRLRRHHDRPATGAWTSFVYFMDNQTWRGRQNVKFEAWTGKLEGHSPEEIPTVAETLTNQTEDQCGVDKPQPIEEYKPAHMTSGKWTVLLGRTGQRGQNPSIRKTAPNGHRMDSVYFWTSNEVGSRGGAASWATCCGHPCHQPTPNP